MADDSEYSPTLRAGIHFDGKELEVKNDFRRSHKKDSDCR